MKKIEIEDFRNFIYRNMGKIILLIAVIFSMSLVAIDLSTNCIIDHDSEKKYNQMENAVEENKEKIISLSNYDRNEIDVGDNIAIIVRHKNIKVIDNTVYSQYYTLDNNTLKKENELMYLSFEGIAFCFVIFLLTPFCIALCLVMMVLIVFRKKDLTVNSNK